MPVAHCKRSPFDVYCGRPNEWGNPFVVGRDGTRDEVIAKHEEWVVRQPRFMEKIHTLHGKTLGCWCSPQRCHCDTLLRLAREAHERLSPG